MTRVVDVDADTVLSDRTPESDSYVDLAVLDGAAVVLVSRRSDETPTLKAARALAAAFTGSRVPGRHQLTDRLPDRGRSVPPGGTG